MKKVYGKDRRLDVATISISEVESILDKHLMDGVLESLYAVMEKGSGIISSNQSAECINTDKKGDSLM